MGEYRIYLTDIIYVLRKNFKYIILLGVVGLLMGIMIYAAQLMLGDNSVSYRVSVSYYVTAEVNDSRYANGGDNPNLSDVNMINNLMDSVVYFCRSTALTDQVAEKAGLTGVDGNQIGRALSVSRYESTQIIQLNLLWSNREEGENIVNAISDLLPVLLKKTMKTGGIEPVDLPKTQEIQPETNSKLVFYMLVLGIALGVVVCVLPLFVRPTIISLNRFEEMFGIPRVGDIPEISNAGKIDSPELQNSLYKESILSAAHIVMHQVRSQKNECSCIYFTSSLVGEGKTTLSANLGIALSSLGIKTVLLDLSVNNNKLSGMFLDHIDSRKSLNAVYYYETELQDAMIKINDHLDILPTAVETNELGFNSRMEEIVNQLSVIYDIVLIDSASLGQSSESLSLNTIADAIILVAHFDDVPVSVLKYNIEKLKKTGAPILGCIVNAIPKVSFNKVGMTSKADDSAAVDSKKHRSAEQTRFRGKKKEVPVADTNISQKQFQRVMGAMNNIDSSIKENMMLDMLTNLEEILDNRSISLYTVDSGMIFARLAVCSKEIMDSTPKSISLDGYKDILQVVGRNKVYSNSDMNNGLPMFVAGILGDKQLDVLIMINHVTASQFNKEYQDMIQMSCDMLQILYLQMQKQTVMNRKMEYEADTGIMEAVRFRQLVDTYIKIREKGVGQFTLIRLGNINKWNIYQKLQGHIRSNDMLGYDEAGSIYLLLSQVKSDMVGDTMRRLKLCGIDEFELIDSLPIITADRNRIGLKNVTSTNQTESTGNGDSVGVKKTSEVRELFQSRIRTEIHEESSFEDKASDYTDNPEEETKLRIGYPNALQGRKFEGTLNETGSSFISRNNVDEQQKDE